MAHSTPTPGPFKLPGTGEYFGTEYDLLMKYCIFDCVPTRDVPKQLPAEGGAACVPEKGIRKTPDEILFTTLRVVLPFLWPLGATRPKGPGEYEAPASSPTPPSSPRVPQPQAPQPAASPRQFGDRPLPHPSPTAVRQHFPPPLHLLLRWL